jgi:hypothetical protein
LKTRRGSFKIIANPEISTTIYAKMTKMEYRLLSRKAQLQYCFTLQSRQSLLQWIVDSLTLRANDWMRIVKIKTNLFDECIADTLNNRKLLIKAGFYFYREKELDKNICLFRSFASMNTRTDTQSVAKRERKVWYFRDLDRSMWQYNTLITTTIWLFKILYQLPFKIMTCDSPHYSLVI